MRKIALGKRNFKKRHGRYFSMCSSQEAFSMAELALVLILMTLLVSVTLIVYYTTMRRTDLKAVTEMIKQEVRRVYALVDSGVKHNGQRDRYRIEFRASGDDPPNAYRVLKREYNGSTWGDWTPLVPEERTSVKIVSEVTGWVQPSTSSETQITSLVGMSLVNGYAGITFVSKGSIIQTDTDAPGSKTITIGSGGVTTTITVSESGSVSE